MLECPSVLVATSEVEEGDENEKEKEERVSGDEWVLVK